MPQVTCLGILVADVVGKPIDHMPEPGTLASVDRVELHIGGCAANTGVCLARLGVQAEIIGKVGRDILGDLLLQSISASGAGVKGVVQDDSGTPTSATIVMVQSDGERSFLHGSGVNATFGAQDIDWDLLPSSPILHVAGPNLMPGFIGEECAKVIAHAKSAGLTTTLDTVWDFTGRWMKVLAPSLPHLDYLFASRQEAKRLTGRQEPAEMAQVFLDAGVHTVAIKLGENGAYVKSRNGVQFAIPAFAVPVVDTLGAGDAWSAGFLTGLVHGWDLEKSVRFANAAGALAVQALGGTAGIRSFEETSALAFGSAT